MQAPTASLFAAAVLAACGDSGSRPPPSSGPLAWGAATTLSINAPLTTAPEVAVDVQPWNRRFRAYTEMLKSGLPSEIAKVLRDMYRLKFDKDLSFGERRLLDQARSLLVQELALAKKVKPDSIEGEIQQILST